MSTHSPCLGDRSSTCLALSAPGGNPPGVPGAAACAKPANSNTIAVTSPHRMMSSFKWLTPNRRSSSPADTVLCAQPTETVFCRKKSDRQCNKSREAEGGCMRVWNWGLVGLFVAAIGCLVLGQSVPPSGGTGPAKGEYRLVKTLPIGGEGRWDYLIAFPATRQLFVTRSSHVQVINLDSGQVTADLKNTPGVHGVALAPDLGRGFTSNGQAGTVTVFDLRTLKPIGTVKAGQNPDAIIFDPFSHKVFAFNGRSNDATVIDAASPDGPTTRIELDGKPEFAGTDGQGHVYV